MHILGHNKHVFYTLRHGRLKNIFVPEAKVPSRLCGSEVCSSINEIIVISFWIKVIPALNISKLIFFEQCILFIWKIWADQMDLFCLDRERWCKISENQEVKCKVTKVAAFVCSCIFVFFLNLVRMASKSLMNLICISQTSQTVSYGASVCSAHCKEKYIKNTRGITW